jgi:hypothetical protein
VVASSGNNLLMRSYLSDDTIMGYPRAASLWLQQECQVCIPLYTNGGGMKKKESLYPYISEILVGRHTWKRSRPRCEPLTGAILDMMAGMAQASSPQGIACKYAALYDRNRLGVFTSSRLAEYGQSALPRMSKADGWDPIPTNRDVPKAWQGKAKAFVASYFEFLDEFLVHIPHREAICNTTRVAFIHFCFQYDKGSTTLIIQK